MRRLLAIAFLLAGPALQAHDFKAGSCSTSKDLLPDVSRGLYAMDLGTRAHVRVLADCSVLPKAGVEVAEVTIAARVDRLAVGTPDHSHPTWELLYVLEGTLRYGLAGKVYEIGPGDMALVRPGAMIFHEPVGTKAVKLLAIWAPAGALGDLQNRFGFTPIPNSEENEE